MCRWGLSDVSVLCPCLSNVSVVFWCCFGDVSVMFWLCFMDVSLNLGGVSVMFWFYVVVILWRCVTMSLAWVMFWPIMSISVYGKVLHSLHSFHGPHMPSSTYRVGISRMICTFWAGRIYHQYFQNGGVSKNVGIFSKKMSSLKTGRSRSVSVGVMFWRCMAAGKCAGKLPISKLWMMEKITWRIHFYTGSMSGFLWHAFPNWNTASDLSISSPFSMNLGLTLWKTLAGGAHDWNRVWRAWRDDTSLATCPTSDESEVGSRSNRLQLQRWSSSSWKRIFPNNSLGNPGETEDAWALHTAKQRFKDWIDGRWTILDASYYWVVVPWNRRGDSSSFGRQIWPL